MKKHINHGGKYDWSTKEGRNAYARDWKAANNDKFRQQTWKSKLKKQYGLTPEDRKAMFEYQGGACAICRRPESDFSRKLHIDHDHSTKLIRGLLCWRCNDLLPNRKDLLELLRRCICYLVMPPAVSALGEERKTPTTGKYKPSPFSKKQTKWTKYGSPYSMLDAVGIPHDGKGKISIPVKL